MADVLFVNACVRGEDSRTLRLAEVFLKTLQEKLPGVHVTCHDLPKMALTPIDYPTLKRREQLCDAYVWDDPLIVPAAQFQQADAVVIAAPYWDMSFPSMLKVWVEHLYIRNLTFKYVNDQSLGLCMGKEAVYLTTAGSPIGEHDWGTRYIKDVLNVLGIPGFTAIKAEALDLAGRDVQAIMAEAQRWAAAAGEALAAKLA